MSKSPEFIEQLEKWGADAIIRKLAPYLSEDRKQRILPIVDHRIRSIQVAVEDPTDVHNALAIVRTSEAFGLTDAHLIGVPRKRKGRQTMRGSDKWMNIHSYNTLTAFHDVMSNKQFRLFAASPRGKIPLEDVPLDLPCCFLFGNEKRGLTERALEVCSLHYTIPMYGFCESFNLSVAAAITLYHVVEKKRGLLSTNGDLSEIEKKLEIAWFYFKSVDNRIVKQILKTN